MEKIKKGILSVILVVLIFYVLFPTALPLFGFSFIFTSGVLGVILYAYNKFPFAEIVSMLLFFGLLIGWAVFCTFINSKSDSFYLDYSKSQIAWMFSAYLIIYIFFKIHPNGGLNYLIYYIIAVITIQGIISVWMYFDPEVAAFFDSLQMSTDLSIGKRSMTEGKRLLGYGVAFFGAGIVYGISLIFIAYIFMTKKLNFLQQLFCAILYVATFLVGLMSARTAAVGLVASLALAVLLYFKGDKTLKSQGMLILFYCSVFTSVGVTLVYTFFPEFADWTFELFLNYQETGELRTNSSDGLSEMFLLPSTFKEWVFGRGVGSYWGSDVGFTRLLFWFGVPGTLLYFGFQYLYMKNSFSGDKAFNLTLVVLFAYNLALNVKGLSDLNHFNSILMMYFLYYRYFIYTPQLYRLGKIRQTSLRYAVQSSASGRRI